MRKILRRMREGSGDINAVARDLGIGRGTLDAILEMAVREEYAGKADVSSGCGGCLLSGKCEVEPSQCDKIGMYVLTPKGEKYADGVS